MAERLRLRISEEPYYSDPLLTDLPDELIRLILFKITDPKTLFVSSLVSKRIASILTHSQSLSLLPGEILRLIFSKISDPKTLLACFLVSKRIASILSHSQSLSLQFPTPLISLSGDTQSKKSFLDLCLLLMNLLRRFNGVRSLHIELPCSCRCPEDIFLKWKAKADVRYGILSFLLTKFVSKINDENVKVEKEKEEEGEENWVNPFKEFWPFYYASAMYLMMLFLIFRRPNLDSVELVDSKKHGKLSLRGEELVKLRTAKNLVFFGPRAHQKIWYAPKLRLPLSGFEMKEVALVVIRGDRVANGKGSGGGGVGEVAEGNVEDALDGGFEDDEHGIFGEAMTQMLTRKIHQENAWKQEQAMNKVIASIQTLDELEKIKDIEAELVDCLRSSCRKLSYFSSAKLRSIETFKKVACRDAVYKQVRPPSSLCKEGCNVHRWQHPPSGTWKFNCDCASSQAGKAAFGIVVRDVDGADKTVCGDFLAAVYKQARPLSSLCNEGRNVQQWQHPPIGTWKSNREGASSQAAWKAAFGIVVRDVDGAVISRIAQTQSGQFKWLAIWSETGSSSDPKKIIGIRNSGGNLRSWEIQALN
ncbi:hypothetical protein Vadar_011328 [Vaccinium darrowii]|uniref:Uncharacterized protein n=1 Tax=Vaccinium darrowii TaxID=229202 RepID=A0ACB7X059_9ERIC|nr:hypothetical protein Vadar_011328 [Vaccinium darrowii]